MQNIKKNIKECNLIFTDTITRLDFCRSDFDLDKIEVKYNNSINLYELASSFNKLYTSFEKEYQSLTKLDLGINVELIDFSIFSFDNDNYRLLELYIDKPTITNYPYTLLFLREINRQIKPFITNSFNFLDKNYYRNSINIDENIAKKYLDLFDKYSVLIESYKYLKNCCLYSDGTFSMYTTIDEYKSNILKGLKSFRISFGCTNYYIYLPINLGNNFGIDYNNCNYITDNINTPLNNNTYENIFNDVYIGKKYIKEKKRNN